MKWAKHPGKSVFMYFRMYNAMLPKNIEFKSLTRTYRLKQSMIKEMAARITPTAHSGSPVDLKRNKHARGLLNRPRQVFLIIEIVWFLVRFASVANKSKAESSNWMIRFARGFVSALRSSILAEFSPLYWRRGWTRRPVIRSR